MAEETLGHRIRRLRTARGLGQPELAAACARYGRQVDRNMIQRWETDENVPTLVNAAALARVLGSSMDVLYYGEEKAARIAAEREAAGDGVEVASGWRES
jgi:transcriptional regulator with XRE-family HTH domain